MGANCESCRPGFNQNPWAPANYRYDEVNQCEEPKNLGSRSGDIRAGVVDSCQCNGHSDRCGAIGQESWCVGCRDNTDGKTCSQCIPGFYSDPKLPTKGKFKGSTAINFMIKKDVNWCRPCNCNELGSESRECRSPGTCSCRPGWTGDK